MEPEIGDTVVFRDWRSGELIQGEVRVVFDSGNRGLKMNVLAAGD